MSDPVSVWQGELSMSGVTLRVHVLSDGSRVIEAADLEALMEAWGRGVPVDEDEPAAFARWQRGTSDDKEGRPVTLADRITSVLTGTGFRPRAEMPLEATHYSGPFFLVTEGAGVTVSVSWTDATDAERGTVLHRIEIRLHEVGLSAERRDGHLYVTETEG